MPKGLNWA